MYWNDQSKDESLSYQVVFILNFIVCYSVMKIVSWCSNSHAFRKGKAIPFFLSPYFSLRSLCYHPLKDTSLIPRFIAFTFLSGFFVVLAYEFLTPLSYLEILLFAPAIYFSTESLGAIGQILFFRYPTFPIHRKPLFATSLSNFWGRDWNLWIQDWLRDVSEGMGTRRSKKRIMIVFFISGLFHELWMNLPYWIMYRKSYFGTMMAYFLIQAVALWIDKRFVKQWPVMYRRAYLWLAVILPSPLFINVPLLTFFGLSHE